MRRRSWQEVETRTSLVEALSHSAAALGVFWLVTLAALVGCGGGGGAGPMGLGASGTPDEGDYCAIIISSELQQALELSPGQRAHMLLLRRDLRRSLQIRKQGMANPSWEYVLKKAERSRVRLGKLASAVLNKSQKGQFEAFFAGGRTGPVTVERGRYGFHFLHQPFEKPGETAEYSRSNKHVRDGMVREEFRSLREGLQAITYEKSDEVRKLAATFVRDAKQADADRKQVIAALKKAHEKESGPAKGHLRDAIQKWESPKRN